MKIGANLTESLSYTKLLFNNIVQLIMLVVFGAIPVVNFVFLGYLGNVMKQPKDSKQLPQLNDYAKLWIQGLKMGIVSIIYLIVPLCIVMPFFDIFGIFGFLPDIRGNAARALIAVGLLLALFLSLILVMALVKLVKHDNFKEALAFGDMMKRISRIGWITCILGLIVIALVVGIVIFVLNMVVATIAEVSIISLPGLILIALITPFFGTFVARSASLSYLEGAPEQETAAPAEQT